jgi:uncharacterized protein
MEQSAPGQIRPTAAEPDLEAAKAYALDRLEREVGPELCYHSIFHTRDDVLPAAIGLAASEGVTGEDLLLLETAAYFHDIGFVERREDHEVLGSRIAADVLPRFGYESAQIVQIVGMIMATRLPQSPQTLLQQILADADLDVLGREDFWPRNQALRDELAQAGMPASDADWYRVQLHFLRGHSYWTFTARRLRDGQKQRHIEMLAELLAEHQNQQR